MPDLEQLIADWRKQMLAAGIQTPVPLEELEIHLREEIERQIRSGLNEQEVFTSAVHNIGQAGVLKNEFSKVGSERWKALKIARATCGLMITTAGCVGLVQSALAFGEIVGWFVNGGSEIIGDTHPFKINARLWAAFMCLFPVFLIFSGLLCCRFGFRKRRT